MSLSWRRWRLQRMGRTCLPLRPVLMILRCCALCWTSLNQFFTWTASTNYFLLLWCPEQPSFKRIFLLFTSWEHPKNINTITYFYWSDLVSFFPSFCLFNRFIFAFAFFHEPITNTTSKTRVHVIPSVFLPRERNLRIYIPHDRLIGIPSLYLARKMPTE